MTSQGISRRASPLSRPPLERMLRIHQAINSGKLPNATTLAAELEVSTKSIQRDIEFMRDRLELPIEYEVARHGYRYDPSWLHWRPDPEGQLYAGE